MNILNGPLNKFGFIANLFERFFRLLQYLPPQCFLKSLYDFHNETDKERVLPATKRNTRIVDLYVFFFLILEISIVCFIISDNLNRQSIRPIKYFILIILSLRLINIMEFNVNRTIFDAVRINNTKIKNQYTASIARNITMIFINYFELILIFGIFYCISNFGSLNNADRWSDYFYFSAITQLTIGYGDITPVGYFKFVSVIQGMCAFYFGAIIIGRFIAIMPRIVEVEDNLDLK